MKIKEYKAEMSYAYFWKNKSIRQWLTSKEKNFCMAQFPLIKEYMWV
jgi:hypothetical protein